MAIGSLNFDAASLAALGHSKSTRANSERAQRQLRTGKRITGFKDDASGGSIAATLKARNAGANEGRRNLQEATAALGIADSALENLADQLNKLKALGVRAATQLKANANITLIKEEISKIKLAMTKAVVMAEYNGKKLIDGSLNNVAVKYGVGSITFSVACCTLGQHGLQLTAGLNLGNGMDTVTKFISIANYAIAKLSTIRGNLGAVQVMIDSTTDSLQLDIDKTEEARSTIEDIDALESQVNATTAQSQQNLSLQALLLALQNNFKRANTGLQTMQLLMQS